MASRVVGRAEDNLDPEPSLSELKWSRRLASRLNLSLKIDSPRVPRLQVLVGKRLAYRLESFAYGADDIPQPSVASWYQTDLLIVEVARDGSWTPRVVIEAKLGRVTTHDALTYSAKAATHKQAHPHLRYGILVGNLGEARVPTRLIRHGAHFDFMVAWRGATGNRVEWQDLTALLTKEIKASRDIEALVCGPRSKGRRPIRLVHRQLVWGYGNRVGPATPRIRPSR